MFDASKQLRVILLECRDLTIATFHICLSFYTSGNSLH